MSDDLHASLTPNIIHTGEVLQVDFDSGDEWKSADEVAVHLFEIDDASPFEPLPGTQRLVVTFRGKLVDNEFSLTPSTAAAPNPTLPQGEAGAPAIKVALGGTTTEVPLPGRAGEQGIFELRLQIVVTKPKPKRFTSKDTVWVRSYDHFMAGGGQKRPVVAFITGAPSDGYFSAAIQYFRLNADVVFEREGISIEEILDILDKEAEKYGDWGQINIVAHGRAQSIAIRLFAGTKVGLHTDLIDREIERFGNLMPPRTLQEPRGLDASSQIVFRACNAGKDQALIDALQEQVFGGTATLHVPKFVQVYMYQQSSGGSIAANEWFEESLTFDTPTSNAPVGAELQAGLEAAWDSLDSPGKGGDMAVEIPTFSDNHDWVQSFPMKVSAMREGATTNSDGKPLTDDELIASFRKDWSGRFELHKKSETWKTKDDRWLITVKSRQKTTLTGVERGFALRVTKGTAAPTFQELVRGSLSVGSSTGEDVWGVLADGVSDIHFHVSLIVTKAPTPLQVEVEDADSGADTLVGTKVLNRGAKATFNLPVTIRFGTAELTVRQAKTPEDIEFECERHHVDRRRKLMTYDPTKPYAERTLVEQPTVGNPAHFGSS